MILCEHGPGGRPAVFGRVEAVITAEGPGDLAGAFAALDAARARGAWIAGYVAYETGYALEPRLEPLTPEGRTGPLLAMGIFSGPQDAAPLLAQAGAMAGAVHLTQPEPVIARDAYDAAMARVLDYIAAGDVYQVNLTFPMAARLERGTPLGLYGALRRTGAVGHGALVDLGVGPVVVSRSPELFFKVEAGGRIVARPMKGTAPRDPDPVRDAAIAAALQASEKDRAENLMIVDLLRNDIARLSEVGSVKVPALFAMERYSTVHQMTSTIEGRLTGQPGFGDLMRALFPCGSVTGAPKIRAMEVIREVEPAPRGVYCGAVGWMAPDGAADFSVAIRTLSVFGDGQVVMNVGGGVVTELDRAGRMGGGAVESALREGGRDEALRLIETLGWDGAALVRGERHLARLARSAARLGWECDVEAARAALLAGRKGPARLRLTLGRAGDLAVTEGPLVPLANPWQVGLARERLVAGDPWLGIKTTRRAVYDAARAALAEGLDEVVFQNERGEVCDGTITTLFFDAGEGMCTPPVSSGLLPGVLRDEMLESRGCAARRRCG